MGLRPLITDLVTALGEENRHERETKMSVADQLRTRLERTPTGNPGTPVQTMAQREQSRQWRHQASRGWSKKKRKGFGDQVRREANARPRAVKEAIARFCEQHTLDEVVRDNESGFRRLQMFKIAHGFDPSDPKAARHANMPKWEAPKRKKKGTAKAKTSHMVSPGRYDDDPPF